MVQIRISGMCALWPWPWSYDLGSRHDSPLSHGKQLCEILSRSNMAVRIYGQDMDFGYVCTVTLTLEVWPWVKVMTHPSVMDNNGEKYYLDPTWQWRVMARTHIFCYVCTLTLTLEVWPWVKVMTHPWVMDNKCEISRSNMAVRSYGPDTEFGYVCTVTLTLEVWPWVKVMTHPWVMDNNCVKYYPDPIWQWGVMARTQILGTCALWP